MPKDYARLTQPLVRDGGKGGELRPASWDEAAAAFQALDALSARAEHRSVSDAAATALQAHLTTLRKLLEFKPEVRSGRELQFNSPHRFDAAAVAQELDRLATLFESLSGRP